jgi:hypothetical protein
MCFQMENRVMMTMVEGMVRYAKPGFTLGDE